MADIQYLNDLEDVQVPTPADNDVLYWDAAASLWKCKAIALGGGIVERVVRFSSDDCGVRFEDSTWNIYLTYDGVVAGFWHSGSRGYGNGMRFLNIYIPKGATITHAYLKLTCRNTDNATEVKSRIRGERNANPPTFSTIANYNARTRTDALIDWDNIPTWTLGTEYTSPDVATIIKEIIDLDAWASGHPLVLFWDDHDLRTPATDGKVRRARSNDHALPVSPILYIEWTA